MLAGCYHTVISWIWIHPNPIWSNHVQSCALAFNRIDLPVSNVCFWFSRGWVDIFRRSKRRLGRWNCHGQDFESSQFPNGAMIKQWIKGVKGHSRGLRIAEYRDREKWLVFLYLSFRQHLSCCKVVLHTSRDIKDFLTAEAIPDIVDTYSKLTLQPC